MRIIKVVLEIGHTSHLKSKKSPDGFTHDWELFVRGADGTNINRFVDKVVFNLHDSFPKPCRVHKEPPYVLKESGYASFNLPIDIYLKAGPRDDPKKYSTTYDLDIYKTIVTKHQIIIQNPSTEFRNKLLDGGGIAVNDGHMDDRMSSQQPDSTTKPRPQSSGGGGSGGSSGSSKKHKIKSDDIIKPTTSTFENLFGSPILNSKNSPDPKLSNNTNNSSSSNKIPIPSSGSSKNSSQKPSKDRSSEKGSKEKRDKKDKSGSTPKEGSKESSSKAKSDEKHERREEKRKEKSTTKDRERSKEKSSKRPPSPKPTSRSPKRSASPPRASSSNSNRHESIHMKYEEKSHSSSSGKKSKKEKRDKSKERERSGDKSKEVKHQMHAAVAAVAAAATAAANKQKEEKLSNKSMEKLNGSSKKDEIDGKERDKSNKYRNHDAKPPSPLDVVPVKMSTPIDAKKSHDKDERKHKHKKKDKNKDKDRKKSKSKDISDESPLSTSSSNRKHSNAPTPNAQSNRLSNTKSNAMTTVMPLQSNQLTDKSSSEFDDDEYHDRISPNKPDKVSSSNDTNQSLDHLMEPIADVVTPRTVVESPKKHGGEKSSGKKNKEPKSNQSSASKEEKKKKRKSKSDKQNKHDESVGSSGGKRKNQSPMVDEPSIKFLKKDDEKMPKVKDDILHEATKMFPGRTPPVPQLAASPSTQKLYHQSPDSSKQGLKRSAENLMNNQSSKIIAHRSPSSASSSPISSDGETSPQRLQQQPPPPPPSSNTPHSTESPGEKQYIAQLQALQQKILTLKDNDELQQVVEMIAETGCYEITNETFDFDLCALDRNTVQRLQERLG
ncbi:protein AF-9 [Contarinia nasturtii]|uniref:protein AF-9 n=1 Tax=Contarinia nasturtii TaxID=265458 RepID=UPI0012D39FC1|nr:protein AF-9 [Contarinia nasturtii]